jgi:DNA repair protein RadA/Sms
MPRRIATGIDINRLNMIIAVLEKRCNISLGTSDIYVNVIGGMKIIDTSIDLAIALAIISSYKNIEIDNRYVFIGEIGLTGEIRSVSNIEKRVKEASKLGYKKIFGCKNQLDKLNIELNLKNVELVKIDTIDQLISMLFT